MLQLYPTIFFPRAINYMGMKLNIKINFAKSGCFLFRLELLPQITVSGLNEGMKDKLIFCAPQKILVTMEWYFAEQRNAVTHTSQSDTVFTICSS